MPESNPTHKRGRYRTIVADPPWRYDEGWPINRGQNAGERIGLPYSSMTFEEIAALPIPSLIAKEGYLFLWTTSRYLEDAYRLVRGWKLRPRQVLTWCKPPVGTGPGGMFATTTEFVLVAQALDPKANARQRNTLGVKIDRSHFDWPRLAHSQKPEAFLDLVEQVSPGPRLEMFARRARFGWDYFGDESLGTVAA